MMITSKNEIFKGKINGTLNKNNISTTFILIVDTRNNGFKSIKSTYHSVIWFFIDQRLQLK